MQATFIPSLRSEIALREIKYSTQFSKDKVNALVKIGLNASVRTRLMP